MNDIIYALWLFIPAGVANAAPVFAKVIPGLSRWKTPLDLGHTYKGKRLTGPNKTWRGVAFGIVLAALTATLQADLASRSEPLWLWFIFGAVLGLGALYGDAVESFIKRQLDISSGHSWFPFDQIDFILGGLLAVAPSGIFTWVEMLAILVIYFVGHLLIAYTGYLLGLKDRPI